MKLRIFGIIIFLGLIAGVFYIKAKSETPGRSTHSSSSNDPFRLH